MLFRLSKYQLLALYVDWLYVDELCRLNTSVCSHKFRFSFQDTISAGCPQPWIEKFSSSDCTIWMYQSNIRSLSAVFTLAVQKHIFQPAIDDQPKSFWNERPKK